MSKTYKEDVNFIEFAVQKICLLQGYSDQHAHYVAEAIAFAHIQGKLNQGLGVFEALDIGLTRGFIDIKSIPEITREGASWAIVDGKGSTGYYVLNMMADKAIELAAESGIAIVFGGNHGDAGSFGRYVYKAFENDMFAMSSNNSVPLAAPFGGMQNLLSCPPFDAIAPAGENEPVWISTKFSEFYDADISEAVFNDQPLNGKWIIDPETGELSDDAAKYARPIDGYGRVWDYVGAGQIEEPRTYAMNMWNESICAMLNPLGVPSTDLPTIEEAVSADNELAAVGGSYYICINPAVFGDLTAMKKRSDNYIDAIKSSKPRPGHSVRVPSSKGFEKLLKGDNEVDVLDNHRAAFFDFIAGRYGYSEEKLRQEYEVARA